MNLWMMKRSILCLPLISASWVVYAAVAVQQQRLDDHTAGLSFIQIDAQGRRQLDPTVTCPIFLVAGSHAKRAIQIKNTSPLVTASKITAKNLWEGVVQDASNCLRVPPQQTCTIYLTAGSQTQPSTQIDFSGTNTTTVSTFINVIPPLTVGQSWSGGLIYSINPDGSSGQVAATSLAATVIFWDPMNGSTITGAEDFNNGSANTDAIVNQLNTKEGQPLDSFAAGSCVLYTNFDSCSTYGEWYLPALNQLTTLMQSGVDSHIFIGADTRFWTSTQSLAAPTEAYSNYLDLVVLIESSPKNKAMVAPLCVRNFSYNENLNAPAS